MRVFNFFVATFIYERENSLLGGCLAIIVDVRFPKFLKAGELITGSITVKNVLSEADYVFVEVVPRWKPDYWCDAYRYLNAGELFTFNFPDDFIDPNAQKPKLYMIDAPATLDIAVRLISGERETVSVTIEPYSATAVLKEYSPWIILVSVGIVGGGLVTYYLVRKLKRK